MTRRYAVKPLGKVRTLSARVPLDIDNAVYSTAVEKGCSVSDLIGRILARDVEISRKLAQGIQG